MNVYDKIAVEKHCTAESSLLKASTVGHLYSLKCHKDLDNGAIVSVGTWASAQIFNSKDFVTGEHPVLILTPPIGYNSDRKAYQDEYNFYNAKDEVARGYELYDGDIFTVSEEIFGASPSVAPAVGKYINASYTVATSAGTSGFVGEIIEKVIYKNSISYRILVRTTGV